MSPLMSNHRFPCLEESYWFQLLLSLLAAEIRYFQPKLLLLETDEYCIKTFAS